MGPHKRPAEVGLEEGHMRLVRPEGSSVVAGVQTRQTPRKVWTSGPTTGKEPSLAVAYRRG
jgi:hypothetical protein